MGSKHLVASSTLAPPPFWPEVVLFRRLPRGELGPATPFRASSTRPVSLPVGSAASQQYDRLRQTHPR